MHRKRVVQTVATALTIIPATEKITSQSLARTKGPNCANTRSTRPTLQNETFRATITSCASEESELQGDGGDVARIQKSYFQSEFG